MRLHNARAAAARPRILMAHAAASLPLLLRRRVAGAAAGAGAAAARSVRAATAARGVRAAVAAARSVRAAAAPRSVLGVAGELPIREVVEDIVAALDGSSGLVLQAPPGAGKTTVVPLALLAHAPAWLSGPQNRIIVLEPRRVAAKAAARRMAAMLGERPGELVGYRCVRRRWRHL